MPNEHDHRPEVHNHYVTHNYHGASNEQLCQLFCGLTELKQQLQAVKEIVMAARDEANQALAEINEATNTQALRMTELGDAQTEIASDIDTLLADAAGNVPPEVLAGMKAASARQKQLAEAIAAHAEFAKAIASKSPATPVPVPVPDPLPEPTT